MQTSCGGRAGSIQIALPRSGLIKRWPRSCAYRLRKVVKLKKIFIILLQFDLGGSEISLWALYFFTVSNCNAVSTSIFLVTGLLFFVLSLAWYSLTELFPLMWRNFYLIVTVMQSKTIQYFLFFSINYSIKGWWHCIYKYKKTFRRAQFLDHYRCKSRKQNYIFILR